MKRTLTALTGLALAVAASAQSTERYSYGDTGDAYNSENTYFDNLGQQSQSRGSSSRPTQVKRLNQASNLIGTDVHDQTNRKIGEVRDVVIDFNSGRVAYVVVNANEVLAGDRTLIAVPARAIRLDSYQRIIKIDADRDRIEHLRAFANNNYPPIRSRSPQMANWQGQQDSSTRGGPSGYYSDGSRSRYSGSESGVSQDRRGDNDSDWYYYEWYLIPSTSDSAYSREYSGRNDYGDRRNRSAQGTYGQSQSGRSGDYSERYSGQRSSDSRTFQNSQNSGDPTDNYTREFRLQHDDQSATARQSRWEAEMPQGQRYGSRSSQSQSNSAHTANNSQTLSGWIRQIDEDNRTLLVEGENETLRFRLAENATVKMNGRDADLSDLRRGQRVDVGYSYRNGANRAFTINRQTLSGRGTNADEDGSSE